MISADFQREVYLIEVEILQQSEFKLTRRYPDCQKSKVYKVTGSIEILPAILTTVL